MLAVRLQADTLKKRFFCQLYQSGEGKTASGNIKQMIGKGSRKTAYSSSVIEMKGNKEGQTLRFTPLL